MSFSSWLRSWNRSLERRSALLKKDRGQLHRKSSRGIRPFLERLEDRINPAPPILNYTVVAQTGDTVNYPNGSPASGSLTNLATASINDSGNVAFLGTLKNGLSSYSGVDEWTVNSGGQTNLSLLNSSYTDVNFSFPQLDSKVDSNGKPVNEVIAQDQYQTASTLDSHVWVFPPNGIPGIPYAQGSADLTSNSGDYVLHPVISPAGSHFAYQYMTPGQLSLEIDGQQGPAFPRGLGESFGSPGGVNMQIANTGAVVLRDVIPSPPPSAPTYAIMVYQKGNNADPIATTAMGFTNLGSSPGISPDGQVVVFYGNLIDPSYLNANQAGYVPTLMPGEGIFASVKTASNGRVILRIAGDDSTTWLNPGETFQNNKADGVFSKTNDPKLYGVSTFDPDSPVAVNSIDANGGVTIVYMAKDDSGNDGIYANRLDFLPNPGQSLNPQDP